MSNLAVFLLSFVALSAFTVALVVLLSLRAVRLFVGDEKPKRKEKRKNSELYAEVAVLTRHFANSIIGDSDSSGDEDHPTFDDARGEIERRWCDFKQYMGDEIATGLEAAFVPEHATASGIPLSTEAARQAIMFTGVAVASANGLWFTNVSGYRPGTITPAQLDEILARYSGANHD